MNTSPTSRSSIRPPESVQDVASRWPSPEVLGPAGAGMTWTPCMSARMSALYLTKSMSPGFRCLSLSAAVQSHLKSLCPRESDSFATLHASDVYVVADVVQPLW